MPRDLCFPPAVELARLYRVRKVSPLEGMQAVLERLGQVNPVGNAFVTGSREGALRPAALCGVVGFRTTPGLIPRYPEVLAWDSYSVEGPMARTVGDTALLLSVMAGPDRSEERRVGKEGRSRWHPNHL